MANRAPIVAVLLGIALVLAIPLGAGSQRPLQDETNRLYGHTTQGWGTNPAQMSNPGPRIEMVRGVSEEFTFHSLDGQVHNLFIVYDGNAMLDGGEPRGPDFSSPAGTSAELTADRQGEFTYRCQYHPETMTGPTSVSAPPSDNRGGDDDPPRSSFDLDDNLLLILIIIGLAIIAVVAAIYYIPRRL